MALVDLKSNLANFRSTFTTPSVANQTVNNLNHPSKTHVYKASDSKLDIDSIPKSYNEKTRFSKLFTDTSKFDRPDSLIFKYTGKTKFTQIVINSSKFNIDNLPSKFSIQGMYTPSKFNSNSVVNKSKFNIDSLPSKFSTNTKYTPTSLYPESKIKPTSTRWSGKLAPEVNFFNDTKSGAVGFTRNFTDSKLTKFIGATLASYTYPNLLGLGDRLVSRPLTNSKFPNSGTATLANQLPMGSVFHYAKDGVIASKKFSTEGYSEKRKYSDNIKSIKGQSDKSLMFVRSTEQNSPSAIDEQYKKFNLRDEAYNPTYIKAPLILRGIQRKGKETTQYWGFGSKAGFDDGLIQGGTATVADRIAADSERIAKWMSSPKGLLWTSKQVGLGLTNPKVEAIAGTFGRQTRIHTGLTSLLSVAGSPLGLHFTTHGIPFANEFASYENVIKTKQLPIIGNTSYSRLIDLRYEFGEPGKFYTNNLIGKAVSEIKSLKTKSLGSEILSGLGGPNSVYGIGFTQIRRVVDTKTDAVTRASNLKFIQTYNINEQYASGDSSAIFKSANSANTEISDKIKVDARQAISSMDHLSKSNERDSLKTRLSKINTTPGAGEGNSIETNEGKVIAYPKSPKSDINNYITMAYGKIPKNANDKSSLNGDFRNALEKDKKGFTGKKADKNYYTNNSLETKYGFGNLGQIGVDRTDPNAFLVKSGQLGTNRKIIITNSKFRGDKVNGLDVHLTEKTSSEEIYDTHGNDLIKFYFQDGAMDNVNSNVAVMAFRATLTGFTDSFSPGWEKIDIMGRPDGAYLYNSFERSISFNFTVAALSRSEMMPMWRKLNYLASYTMPDFNGNSKPSGPFMRITIGHLFQQTPGFISSLSYSIPDDATWDIAEDYIANNKESKQLPMLVDVAVSFTIVGDYRPQMHGRVYSLSDFGAKGKKAPGQWLGDSIVAK